MSLLMTVATLHSSPAKKGLRVYQGSAWKSGARPENAAQNKLVQINNFVSQDDILDFDMLYFLFEEPLANYIEPGETLRKNPSKTEQFLGAIENL
ncbi:MULTISPECIES: hypothetical protein [Enterobacteriaceae]|uniref:hypothetical protein n=1 Tax=Enterobacteriaceae TaxID=543 RepID=UPI001643A089|nr:MULTISPECIES: hypothetical protein [Enterobacteriaceae]MCR4457308.1 hypothetical protein [Pseudescherichia sp. L3]